MVFLFNLVLQIYILELKRSTAQNITFDNKYIHLTILHRF